ncbi:MAG: stability/partitioning determinant, partial [Oxalobacteraceae bacterium]
MLIRQPIETLDRRRRRYTTGRNQQLNVKATAATVERFYRLA